MKKVKNIVRGLLVAALFAGVVSPSMVLAADNESIPLSGDAHAIVTSGGTSYVSNFNSAAVFTVSFPSTSNTNSFSGDAAYGLSFAGSNLFVAAGKFSPTSTGGLQVFSSSNLSTPLSVYGTDTYTYSKVFVVGNTAFVAFLDNSYAPQLEAVNYATPASPSSISTVPLNPGASTGDITSLSVSGSYAYVGIQDDGSGTSGGYVNIVNISNPASMSVVGTYTTSDAVTSVAINGNTLYVGHGSSVDVVNVSTPATPTLSSTISTAGSVNGLTTDVTNLYAATTNGLQVYNLASSSLVGRYNTTNNATAVSVDGSGYIYLATSNGGSSSTIFKIKMVVITLTGANPQTIQLGAGYTELGATTSDGSTVQINSSAFVDAVGSYNVTYTSMDSLGNPGLQVTRTVNVVDTTPPVITLTAPNPQTVQVGANCYTELGATTNDGSLVQINSAAVNCSAVGSYSVIYDSIDSSGNNAIQVTRTVNVVALAHTITASASANGSISPSGAVMVADGGSQTFTITPNAGYSILSVSVDGTSVGAVPSYTFNSVTANHTISASFQCISCFTITASANSSGSISPSGAVLVNSGNNQTFTITPNSNAQIVSVLVDGVSVGAVTTYTFTNVIANHTIVANFISTNGGGGGGRGGGGGAGNGNPNAREIPGCGMRTTGYSSISGVSCINNIPHNEGEVLGADKFIFTLFLKKGPPYPMSAYGNEVMELQKFLNAHGYNSGVVDGKFGPITKGSVIKFQLANGLKGDGLVGPLTRAVLNK